MLRRIRNLLLVIALVVPVSLAADDVFCEPADAPGCSKYCEGNGCTVTVCCEEDHIDPQQFWYCEGGEPWSMSCEGILD